MDFLREVMTLVTFEPESFDFYQYLADFHGTTREVAKTWAMNNALRMLDNYQPPAPEFKAGDIVERISGPLHTTASQFLVLGGSIDMLHDKEYGERGIAIRLTDGLTTWKVLSSSLRKVGRLRDL